MAVYIESRYGKGTASIGNPAGGDGRLPGLDGLRGLAILLVMMFLTVLGFPFQESSQSTGKFVG